jgi:hypothetical protein
VNSKEENSFVCISSNTSASRKIYENRTKAESTMAGNEGRLENWKD